MGLLPLACMSQPQSETVTKPQPASHNRRASSICLPSRFDGPPHVVPLRDVLALEQLAGVVLLDGLRVFLREIERLADAARDDVEGLLLEAIEPFHRAGAVDLPPQAVELGQQLAAVVEAFRRQRQLEVLLAAGSPPLGSKAP